LTVNDQAPKTEEDIKEERRRQRWNWFWTPFITMTVLVSSVAVLMMLIQTCQQRNLPIPLLPPTSPLHQPAPAKTPGSDNNQRAIGEDGPAERSPAK
jgi:hypothetical protein